MCAESHVLGMWLMTYRNTPDKGNSQTFEGSYSQQCFIQRVGNPKLKDPPQALLTPTIYIYLYYFPTPGGASCPLPCHLRNNDSVWNPALYEGQLGIVHKRNHAWTRLAIRMITCVILKVTLHPSTHVHSILSSPVGFSDPSLSHFSIIFNAKFFFSEKI